MSDILKRIDEIKAEAIAISEKDERTAEDQVRLTELLTEKNELVAQHDAEVKAEAALAELLAEPEVVAIEEEKEEEAPAEEAPAEAPAEADAPAEEEAPAETEAIDKLAIAAAVNSTTPKNPVMKTNSEPRKAPLVASINNNHMSVGVEMQVTDMKEIAQQSLRAGAGTSQKYATIKRSTNDDNEVSDRQAPIENTRRLYTKSEDDGILPLTAAACFCGPFSVDKDVPDLGEDDRPVADLFRNVAVTGPFSYFQNLSMADVAAGVTQWECSDQEAIDPDDAATWKPCVDLDCQDPVTVDPYAVVACGIVSKFQQLSHPELVDAFLNKLAVRYARVAETLLLDEIRATSTNLTYNPTGFGLLWEIEQMLGALAGLSSFGSRIDWSQYQIILPPGLKEAITSDEHLRGFTSGATWEEIVSRLRSLGLGGVTIARDADTIASAFYATAITTYVAPGTTVAFNPDTAIPTWTLYVVPVDAYTVGRSTLVEAGWQTDASLTRQNIAQHFYEGLEFIEKVVPDIPSYTFTLSGCANGGTSALTAPLAC